MKHPPYHLRLNKAVDRHLLVELMQRAKTSNIFNHLDGYTYYGLGGPLLEDFKIIHHYFPDTTLVSFEYDQETYKRQLFHTFTNKIDLRNYSINESINSGTLHDNVIIWLDFIDTDLGCFTQFQSVIKKVESPSIIRITVQSDLKKFKLFLKEKGKEVLIDFEPEQIEDIKKLEDIYEAIYDDYRPALNIQLSLSRGPHFIELVIHMLKIASEKALPSGCGRHFQILNVSSYSDGTQMVSVTGVLANIDDIQKIKELFKDWSHVDFDWNKQSIRLPFISLKERMHLSKLLPMETPSGEALKDELGYTIDEDASTTIDKMEQYARFYRFYPDFVRIQT